MRCFCGSSTDYQHCCAPYIEGQALPQTPEVLMRSRYSAYTIANLDYIEKTMRGPALNHFNKEDGLRFAKRAIWLKLVVFNAHVDTIASRGYVEFEATFIENGFLKSIHERSEFLYEHGQWYYTDGKHLPSSHGLKQLISRQALCPCGSGKKFKNCHSR